MQVGSPDPMRTVGLAQNLQRIHFVLVRLILQSRKPYSCEGSCRSQKGNLSDSKLGKKTHAEASLPVPNVLISTKSFTCKLLDEMHSCLSSRRSLMRKGFVDRRRMDWRRCFSFSWISLERISLSLVAEGLLCTSTGAECSTVPVAIAKARDHFSHRGVQQRGKKGIKKPTRLARHQSRRHPSSIPRVESFRSKQETFAGKFSQRKD